ncbi:inactive rhomboid protein 1 isoform X2 [Xyrichtys novacula]|uniref:Inactive rhomboid protein n=1 Tax=Xyrichtys novacula TaxID=13765 RepID=A0AAV1H3U8_XYRNO|nr:inactive rhomboid protein 1 isoform X2 [Xyrichtys novacula]
MDEPGSRNNSLQRKKPPWLKLDIPTIQLTPDDTPTLNQPLKRLRSVSMPGENPKTRIAALETSNNYLRPHLERLPSFTQSIKRGTADWFGVSKDSDTTQRWRRKSLQHCSHLYGGLKPQVMREMELHSQDNLSLASTETPPPLYLPSHHPSHHHYGMQRVGLHLGHYTVEDQDSYSLFPPVLISPSLPYLPLHSTLHEWRLLFLRALSSCRGSVDVFF